MSTLVVSPVDPFQHLSFIHPSIHPLYPPLPFPLHPLFWLLISSRTVSSSSLSCWFFTSHSLPSLFTLPFFVFTPSSTLSLSLSRALSLSLSLSLWLPKSCFPVWLMCCVEKGLCLDGCMPVDGACLWARIHHNEPWGDFQKSKTFRLLVLNIRIICWGLMSMTVLILFSY